MESFSKFVETFQEEFRSRPPEKKSEKGKGGQAAGAGRGRSGVGRGGEESYDELSRSSSKRHIQQATIEDTMGHNPVLLEKAVLCLKEFVDGVPKTVR